MNRTVQLIAGTALAGALVLSCSVNDNPHDDEDTTFPLVGVHAAIECEACHGDGEFTSLPADCVACHEEDRPNRHHGKQSCGNAGCHTPVGWDATGGLNDDDDDTTTPTDFHETFPLAGVHDIVDCVVCHEAFPDTDTERIVCTDCHEDDRLDLYHYAGQDCAHCHPMESGWSGYQEHPFVLPHDNGNVAECFNCHDDPANGASGYACLDACHPQKETDAIHAAFQGYYWESTACVGCHPDGQ